jgi:hypothetical protein
MSAALALSFSGLLFWACAASWRSRAASRWLIAPAHRCTASDTVKDSSVIIACNAAPARCSVAAMVAFRSPSAVNTSMASFSSRRSRSAGSRRRFAHTSDAANLAAAEHLLPPKRRPGGAHPRWVTTAVSGGGAAPSRPHERPPQAPPGSAASGACRHFGGTSWRCSQPWWWGWW